MPQDKSAHTPSFSDSVPVPDPSPSATSEPMGLFSHDIIVESHGYVERRAANYIGSVFLHALLIGFLAFASFFTPVGMNLRPWERVMLIVPSAPFKMPVLNQRNALAPVRPAFPAFQLVAPVFSQRGSMSNLSASPPPAGISWSALSAAFASGDVLGGIVSNSPVSLVSPVVPASKRRFHLGGDVTNSRPLGRLILAYPELAKVAHIFGKVVIHAVIDETGRVVNARAVSGPPLLYATALDAVSKEHFQPMLLNGVPTQSELTVQVRFRLQDRSFF